MMPPTGINKARAWRLAAAHIDAIAQDKLTENHLTAENRRVWQHVLDAVVPSLDRRATIIENKRRARPRRNG